jgi:hypothetical protein
MRSSDRLQLLDPVDSARYDYDNHESSNGCLPGTRESLLASISDWSTDVLDVPCFWLSGLAGTGKTTIGHSICSRIARSGHVVVSFFFSRSEPERKTIARVIPTLLYQLAVAQPQLTSAISAALEINPDLARRSPQLQCRYLITQALGSATTAVSSVLVVLDALDECDNDGGELLPLLAAELLSLPFQVKLLVTSRPTENIHAKLQSSVVKQPQVKCCVLHELSRSTVDDDIRLYLRHRLSALASGRSEQTLWPSDVIIDELVRRAGALFIYAVTAVEYIANKYEDPENQLARLLSADGGDIGSDFGRLNSLYDKILQGFLPSDQRQGERVKLTQRFRDIVGTVVLLQTPMTVSDLSALLDMNPMQTWKTLQLLRAVLIVPSSPNHPDTVRIFHESFTDYLMELGRCADAAFAIDASEHHGRLAMICLQLMTCSLSRDLWRIGNHAQFDAKEHNTFSILDEIVPPHLHYACLHWAIHLSRATQGCASLMNALSEFMETKVVFWIETLSLLGKLAMAIPSLRLAQKWSLVRSAESFQVHVLID